MQKHFFIVRMQQKR